MNGNYEFHNDGDHKKKSPFSKLLSGKEARWNRAALLAFSRAIELSQYELRHSINEQLSPDQRAVLNTENQPWSDYQQDREIDESTVNRLVKRLEKNRYIELANKRPGAKNPNLAVYYYRLSLKATIIASYLDRKIDISMNAKSNIFFKMGEWFVSKGLSREFIQKWIVDGLVDMGNRQLLNVDDNADNKRIALARVNLAFRLRDNDDVFAALLQEKLFGNLISAGFAGVEKDVAEELENLYETMVANGIFFEKEDSDWQVVELPNRPSGEKSSVEYRITSINPQSKVRK
jgi:hypothetical protein